MRSLKPTFKLIFFVSVFFSSVTFGHARFLAGGNTPGRSNNPGLKSGPCGGVAKVTTPTIEFQKGQTITLQWEETVNHPGRFEFSISNDNDQTFQLLLTVPDTQNDNNTPHRYNTNLKLPDDLTCDNCTLQMIQQMTENPNLTRPYFSCSDIRIVEKDTPTPEVPVDETKSESGEQPDCH